MDPVTIAEVLDERGEVRARTRIRAATFRVGKGLENDVILSHGAVDEVHAKVRVEKGRYLVRDLGSESGTYRRDSGERIEGALELGPGEVVRLGDVWLRFVPISPAAADASSKVTTAPRDDSPSTGASSGASRASLRDRKVGWPATLGVLALALAMTAYGTFLSTFDGTTGTTLLYAVLGILVIAGLWAGAWGLATKLARGRSYFRHHLAVTSLGMVALFPLSLAGAYLDTIWPTAAGRAWFDWIQPWLISTVVLLAHIDLASVATRARKAVIAGFLMLGILGLGAVASLAGRGGLGEIRAVLRPLRAVPPGLILAGDTDSFLERVDGLEARLSDEQGGGPD